MFREDGIEGGGELLLAIKVYFIRLQGMRENAKRFRRAHVSAMRRTGIPSARDRYPSAASFGDPTSTVENNGAAVLEPSINTYFLEIELHGMSLSL